MSFYICFESVILTLVIFSNVSNWQIIAFKCLKFELFKWTSLTSFLLFVNLKK
jgi:hypothetical protein